MTPSERPVVLDRQYFLKIGLAVDADRAAELVLVPILAFAPAVHRAVCEGT